MNNISREFLEEFCKDKEYCLSESADKVIEKINKKEGKCPCRIKSTPCPCPMHQQEIKDRGRCTCNLFVRRTNPHDKLKEPKNANEKSN